MIAPDVHPSRVPLTTVLWRFFSLGLIAFGGPPAHVALMQIQDWRIALLDDASFASLFALTQCLPGPSSTQLAIALGVLSGGPIGGLVAFVGFGTMPMIVMTVAGTGLKLAEALALPDAVSMPLGWALSGLISGAVSLVAAAAIQLSTSLAKTPLTQCCNIMAASFTLLVPGTPWLLPVLLGIGGLATTVHAKLSKGQITGQTEGEVKVLSDAAIPISACGAYTCLLLWLIGLVGLTGARTVYYAGDDAPWWLILAEPFYRIGSLVWGGGPVVIPMLINDLVPNVVTNSQFLQGFALVQAMPGPNFSVSAFLGGVYNGPIGALVAWLGMFVPGLLLIHGVLPFWGALRKSQAAQTVLEGVNAAASGLVVAAVVLLWHELCTLPQQAICLVCFAFHYLFGGALVGPKLNAPLTVLLGALLGLPVCALTGQCGCE